MRIRLAESPETETEMPDDGTLIEVFFFDERDNIRGALGLAFRATDPVAVDRGLFIAKLNGGNEIYCDLNSFRRITLSASTTSAPSPPKTPVP